MNVGKIVNDRRLILILNGLEEPLPYFIQLIVSISNELKYNGIKIFQKVYEFKSLKLISFRAGFSTTFLQFKILHPRACPCSGPELQGGG